MDEVFAASVLEHNKNKGSMINTELHETILDEYLTEFEKHMLGNPS